MKGKTSLHAVFMILVLAMSMSPGVQATSDMYSDSILLQLEYRSVNSPQGAQRLSAFDSLTAWVIDAVRADPYKDLSFLRSLAIIAPADSAFRMISSQVQESFDTYHHFGMVYVAAIDSSYVLQDQMLAQPWQSHSVSNWKGALYYKAKGYAAEGKARYLLFGFDGYVGRSHRKVVDVVEIGPKGQWQFVSGDFAHGPSEFKDRIELIYSSDISTKLTFDDDLQMIVFDHLIPMSSVYEKGKMVMVADGSYEGFALKDGQWTYVEKLFHQVSDAPPGQGLPKERKELFNKKGN